MPDDIYTQLIKILDQHKVPELLKNDEIFFNAARLDRSMALKTSDYVALTKPRLECIAKYS